MPFPICQFRERVRSLDCYGSGMPALCGRKRGDVLRTAVLAAALAEITEVGVRGASMARIAQRAGTGKAALYRRWPNVQALAFDALVDVLESALPAQDADTGSLRSDLVTTMEAVTTRLRGDLSTVLRSLIGEATHEPRLAVEFTERFGLRLQMTGIAQVQRAIMRGEIPPQAIDPYVMAIPAALVMHQLILAGTIPSAEEVVHIVDALILPLLQHPATSSADALPS